MQYTFVPGLLEASNKTRILNGCMRSQKGKDSCIRMDQKTISTLHCYKSHKLVTMQANNSVQLFGNEENLESFGCYANVVHSNLMKA